jgi:hypothetical protein
MSNVPAFIHDGLLTAGAASLLYASAVTTAVLVALFAPTPARRRAARDVLTILLRRQVDRR